MKRKIFAFCILMLAFSFAKSQSDTALKKPGTDKTFLVQLKNRDQSDFGYLAGMNDSALQVAYKRVKFSGSLKEDPAYKTYNYQNIERMRIGKYGSVGRGFGIGALAGFGAGGTMGAVFMGDSFFGAAAIFVFGVIAAIPGTMIGGLLGSHKRKFNINRNKENFDHTKASVLETALSNNRHIPKDSTNSK